MHWIRPGEAIPPADLIILPGSKSTRGDLKRLREQGWDAAIHRHLRYGGKLIGICGGFQMLGRWVHDPTGLEGEPARRWPHPAVRLSDDRPDGALSDNGQLLGTYLHGLFDAASARDALLRWAGLAVRETPDYRQLREDGINRLADAIEAHLDLRLLKTLPCPP